jgi:hypothetical protein
LRNLIYNEILKPSGANVPENVYHNEMNSIDLSYHLIGAWKFATKRTISGTPNYIVNGVVINEPKDWKIFLDNLL